MLRPALHRIGLSPTHWLAWLVVCVALVPRLGLAVWNPVDVGVYRVGGQAVLDGTPLYGVAMVKGLYFTYPPFAAAVFTVFAAVGATLAPWLLLVANVAAYLGCVFLVCRRLGLDRVVTALLLVGGLTLEPTIRTFTLGQINLILMVLVLWDCLGPRYRFRGVLVGIAAGIKIVPGAFVVYFLLRRQWAAAAWSAVGFLLTVVVGVLATPSGSREFWSGGLLGMGKFGEFPAIQRDNQSGAAVLLRFTGQTSMTPTLTLVFALVCVGLAAWVAHHQIRAGDHVAAVVSIAVGTLLGSPISWSHHWVWIILALPVLVSRGQEMWAWGIGLFFFFAPHWAAPMGLGVELTFDWRQKALVSLYPVLGLVLLAVLRSTVGRVRTRRTGHPADSEQTVPAAPELVAPG